MKIVELWKKERVDLLMMRYSVLRGASRTSLLTRLRWGRCTVLTIVVGKYKKSIQGGCHRGVQSWSKTMWMSPEDHPWTTTSADVPGTFVNKQWEMICGRHVSHLCAFPSFYRC
jgi:hypothetical protein